MSSKETDRKSLSISRKSSTLSAKQLARKSSGGHEYIFSEGAIPMVDDEDKPARTMLTSEGGFNRSTHIVKDKKIYKANGRNNFL